MVEEIEETLQEKYPEIKIEVEYVKRQLYLITVGTTTIFYRWQNDFTYSENLTSIEENINKFIIKRRNNK